MHVAAKAEFQIELDLKVIGWKCLRDSILGGGEHWLQNLAELGLIPALPLRSFINYLLNTCYVQGGILGSGHTAENQTDKVLTLVELTF